MASLSNVTALCLGKTRPVSLQKSLNLDQIKRNYTGTKVLLITVKSFTEKYFFLNVQLSMFNF